MGAWLLKHGERYPVLAWIALIAYTLANKATGVGRPARTDEDRKFMPWYAKAIFGATEHLTWRMGSDKTLCGALVHSTSSSEMRTLIGIDCWRCILIARRERARLRRPQARKGK